MVVESKWRFLWNRKTVVSILFLFALVASFQSLVQPKKTWEEGGKEYNRYNNYTIFERSFHHLKNQEDLYILFPEEQWDLYKYSPTFSVFFGVFAVFPDALGLTLWNLLNCLIVVVGIYYLPKFTEKQKGLILLFSIFEMLTSLQNSQSNGLMAGLLILAFGLLERKHIFWAALLLVFSVYIKLFGLVGFALFLFYPQKIKFILYSLFWAVVLFLLPLLFVDIHQYTFLFKSWGNMLSNDHSASYGLSVMGWLNAWFGWAGNKLFVVGLGVLLFLIPLLRFKQYANPHFRLLMLVSILLWTVIFNHKAESPTFIIAFSGAAIWFFSGNKSPLNLILFAMAFIFTTISPTDLFPKVVRNEFIEPFQLKVFPCILIWFKVLYDLLFIERDRVEVAVELEKN
jgi:hypothetical protein